MKEYMVIENDRVVARYTSDDVEQAADLVAAFASDPRLLVMMTLAVHMPRIFAQWKAANR